MELGGAEVRRETRWCKVGRVVSDGMVRGIAEALVSDSE